ncbi:hypothetical protein Poli38472_008248 [Pythium oligandrum]|uniref:Cytochrome P450 n=1 Tax=Pythium oligandrum TaxID=41045 RepID=A0A8K1CMZ3_PYTOL|nr:hypothetical protein Poli38472_008248 [Pythium oligandrum]|eukprot:TMW65606.1 hypothetical protein Poli38472_008248 [Pythium oligandrum]
MFMRTSIKKNVGRVHAVLEKAIKDQNMLDLKALFHEFTLDTFVEMGLGVDLASIGSTTKHPIQEALAITSKIVFERARRPWWKLERWLNVGQEGERTRQMAMVYAWIHDVIQTSVDRSIHMKRSGEDASEQSCKSIVELFLDNSKDDVDGLMTDDFVDFVLNLVLRARDTPADTLTWIFYCISQHPDVEKKLREELNIAFPGHARDNSTYLTTEQIKPLVYLEAVIKETIRLYPVAALTFREAAEDTVICGDIFVRKGQLVMMTQYSMSRSTAIWGPDASQFRPERWIDSETGKIKLISPFKFLRGASQMNHLADLDDPRVSLLAGTALAALALTLHTLRKPKEARRYRVLEEPPTTWPVVGNVVDVVTRMDDFHDWITENTLKFEGRPWKFSIPGEGEMIVLTTSDAVEEVMATQFKKFIKGAYQIDLLSGVFGVGVVTSDGERWYHQRKTAVKFFSANVLDKFMRQSIQKNVNRVHDVMEKAILTEQLVDLRELFHDFTLDTFVEMGLGVELKSIGAKERHPFHESIEIASRIVSERFHRVELIWKLERWLVIGEEGRLKRNMDVVYEWLHTIIQESVERSIQKKQSDEEASKSCKSVVELFLEHSKDGLEGLTQDDLVDFVLTLVIGARDTTADTLSWLFYSMGKHPEVEKKLRDEFDSKLAHLGRDPSTYLTMEHLKPLVYLEAVIKETIRLYPAAPFTFREAADDTVICGDVFVRKGQQVVTAQYAIARSPAVWGPDAAEFHPERWVDSETGKIKAESSFKFLSFSAGPRICAGMSLAMMELRILTANLLYRYRFEVDPANNGMYRMAVTLPMKHSLLAKPIAL